MKFIVETYGCTMNQGESAELVARLSSLGHQQVFCDDEADTALINTCVVIEPTERKIMRRLRQLSEDGKRLIIVGCMASIGPEGLRKEFPGALISGTSDYPRFMSVLDREIGACGSPIPSMEGGPLILPIAQGCNGSCSYCITKLARGELVSYPISDLVRKVEHALRAGTKEVLVTSQDTAAYGMDGEDRLPDLLNAICSLPGDFRVRIGMMNPDNLVDIMDGMVDVYAHPRVYRFLHLPVQSGSDRVIQQMGRAYTAESYVKIVERLRSSISELTLSTDVITGFPGETEEDHRRTVDLMAVLRPNIINVTRYSRRPGTVADSMKGQVPGWVSKERSREITRLRFRISTEINRSKIGRTYSVLMNEKGKGSSVMARTDDYLPVVIKGDHELGRRVNVRITGCASTHLYGEIVPGMEN